MLDVAVGVDAEDVEPVGGPGDRGERAGDGAAPVLPPRAPAVHRVRQGGVVPHVLDVAVGVDAEGHAPADDDPPAPLAADIDRAIRLSTAAAVLAMAGIAAYVSYWHAYAVVRAHGEIGITAGLEPATIDGLVYASSVVVLYAARHRVPVPSLARWLLGLGIAATLTANMAQAGQTVLSGRWSLPGRRSASWARTNFLVWLIRTSGPTARGPTAVHRCTDAACRTAVHPLPVPAVDGERSGGSERGTSDPAWRPAGQTVCLQRLAGQPAVQSPKFYDVINVEWPTKTHRSPLAISQSVACQPHPPRTLDPAPRHQSPGEPTTRIL